MYHLWIQTVKFTTLLCVLCIASGCMLMFNGKTENFTVLTVPEGAEVKLSDGQACTSPCTAEVKRKPPIEVEIRKDGCRDEDVLVRSRSDGLTMTRAGFTYTGLLFGSLFTALIGIDGSGSTEVISALGFITGVGFLFGGIPTDIATGSLKSHSPNPLMVTLDCS